MRGVNLQVKLIKSELEKHADIEKAGKTPKAFKQEDNHNTDQFLGVKVPDQRKVAKAQYVHVGKQAIAVLLHDPIHEVRLTAVFLLIQKFEKAKSKKDKEKWVNLYLNNLEGINNWDLVDSSAYQLLGRWLAYNPRDLLYEFAHSTDIWKKRIAMVATYHFIRNNEFEDTLAIAEILLENQHDLLQKAVGWMLKEVGKRDENVLRTFIKKHHKNMPRTALRTAIEKLPDPERKAFLIGTV